MLTYSAGELQRKLGEIQDQALRQPVSITRHGRARLVIMAVEEYHRLKQRDRVVLRAGELSDDDLAAIATADVPGEFAHLDAELSEG